MLTSLEISKEIFYKPATNDQAEKSIQEGADLIDQYVNEKSLWKSIDENPTKKDSKIIAITEHGQIDHLYFKKNKWCHADWDLAGFYPINIKNYTHWIALGDLPSNKNLKQKL